MQLEVDAVEQRLIGCIDNVFRDTDGPPAGMLVPGFDQHANGRGRAEAGRQHADLVIQELELLELGIEFFQRLAQGIIKGIDRPAAFGSGTPASLRDAVGQARSGPTRAEGAGPTRRHLKGGRQPEGACDRKVDGATA